MPDAHLRGVRFAYPGGADVYPEPGLTLQLGTGVTAVIGENGAGKTTLTKLLNGLLRPHAGTVMVAGTDVATQTVARMARLVGYVFQNPDDQLFERTVRAEVGFGPRALGWSDPAEAVESALERCGLIDRADVHPHDLGLAERKWVAIASALAAGTPVLVLDEPTLGQDQRSRERLKGLVGNLAAEGRLILVVTHDMDFVAEACATAVVLTRGLVRYAGPTAAAFEDEAVVADAGLRPPHVTRLARALGLPGPCVREADLVSRLHA